MNFTKFIKTELAMMNNDTVILKKVSFSNLTNWSVRYLLDFSFEYNLKYNLEPIKKLLEKNKNITIVNKDKTYKRITVKINGNDVVLRNIEKGINIGTKKQYVVKKGQFIISKIDARNGAMGIIPNNLDGAIVTNDFPTFDIDYNLINPIFLVLITTTKTFINFAQSCSSGTTNRQRINLEQFLNIKIPLPPLEEQNRIVSNYNAKIELNKQQEEKVKQLEQEIEDYLFETLGIEQFKKKETKKGLQFVRFKNVNRWDIWVNKFVGQSNKYNNTVLKSVVIGKPMYGANVKGIKQKSDVRYIRITDINESGELNNEFVSPEYVEEKYLLRENDFLIARSGNTVGKTFLFKKKFGKAIFAGYLVKYNLDLSKINPDYLLLFTKSLIFKKWIKANQRISGQPNINGQEFLQSPLILPPLEIQQKIANHTSELKQQIKFLKQQAKKNRKLAIKEFANEIFG